MRPTGTRAIVFIEYLARFSITRRNDGELGALLYARLVMRRSYSSAILFLEYLALFSLTMKRGVEFGAFLSARLDTRPCWWSIRRSLQGGAGWQEAVPETQCQPFPCGVVS